MDTQEPLRLLAFIKGLGAGGAEHLLLDQVRNRDRDRVVVAVAHLLDHKDVVADQFREAGVPVRSLGVASVLDLRWLVRFVRLVRQHRPDVVHVHSPLLAAFVRVLVHLLPGRPALVYTEHNRWGQYVLPTRLANAVTYLLDDAKVAVSDGVARSVPARARGHMEVILNGIDVAAARAAADRDGVRAELGLAPEQVAVVSVANLRREKDHTTMLRAARAVLDERDDVVFLSVGAGPTEDDVRALHRELGLGDAFRFLGFRRDAIRVVSGCDVFTLSSRHEGFPLAMMEAMALGLPVVATAVGGIPEAVTDGVHGRLVEAGDVDGLARAYLDVVGDPARRAAMAEAAGERGGTFDSRPAIARLEAIYARVVAA